MHSFIRTLLLSIPLLVGTAIPTHTATSALPIPTSYAAVRVAFTGKDGNVYMMDANGNTRTQLTTLASNGSGVSYPWYAWSPDHKYLLLVRRQANGGSNMLLLNRNGQLLSTLATEISLDYPAFYPNWAIDDDVILYVAAKRVSASNSCDVTLFVNRVNVQGIKTPLWKYPAGGCFSGGGPVSNVQASDLANNELPGYAEFILHWSVKRQYAVYFGDSSLQVTNWQTGATAHFPQHVYDVLASPSGSFIAQVSDNKVVLYRDKPFLTVQGMSPVWSPDSRFLYVERCQTNGRCAIFEVEVAQGRATQLVSWQNVYSFGSLHVTSDGQALIFSRIDVTGPQQAQVSIQRLDGGGLTTLATNASRPSL